MKRLEGETTLLFTFYRLSLQNYCLYIYPHTVGQIICNSTWEIPFLLVISNQLPIVAFRELYNVYSAKFSISQNQNYGYTNQAIKKNSLIGSDDNMFYSHSMKVSLQSGLEAY